MNLALSLTAFNRPQYLINVLYTYEVAWTAVGPDPWGRYYANIDPSDFTHEILNICEGSVLPIKTFVNPVKRGALGNPWWAAERAFEAGAEFVVVGEDDTVVSKDVLRFFRFCAEKYKHDSRVFAVCSWNWGKEKDKHMCDDPAHLTTTMFHSAVWGTWKDRWHYQMRDTWDFNYLNKGWDHNFNDNIMKEDQVCLHPCVGRSQHIGERGTHTHAHNFEYLQSARFELVPPYVEEWYE